MKNLFVILSILIVCGCSILDSDGSWTYYVDGEIISSGSSDLDHYSILNDGSEWLILDNQESTFHIRYLCEPNMSVTAFGDKTNCPSILINGICELDRGDKVSGFIEEENKIGLCRLEFNDIPILDKR